MSPRKKSTPLSSIDLDKLRDLYVVQALPMAKVAKALDISVTTVWKSLDSIGIPRRSTAKFDLEVASKLYFDQGWTLQQIADKFGVSKQAVQQKLTLAGYDIQATRMRARLLDPGPLRESYVDQNLPVTTIAAKFGTTEYYITRSLREYGISRPSRLRKHFERELIEDLYLKQGLLVREIAVKLGINTSHVSAELNRHNITFRNHGRKRIVRPDRNTLDRLYTDEGLSFAEIGRKFGISQTSAIRLVNNYGIKRRRGRNSLSLLGVGRDRLYELYVTNKMTAVDIGKMFGVSNSHVANQLRLHGIERRPRTIALEPALLQNLIEEEGLTFNQAAGRIGISYEVVRREAVRHGFIDRQEKAARTVLDEHSLHKLYIDDGLSPHEIADRLGLAVTYIWTELRRLKIKFRPPARASTSRS